MEIHILREGKQIGPFTEEATHTGAWAGISGLASCFHELLSCQAVTFPEPSTTTLA